MTSLPLSQRQYCSCTVRSKVLQYCSVVYLKIFLQQQANLTVQFAFNVSRRHAVCLQRLYNVHVTSVCSFLILCDGFAADCYSTKVGGIM